MHKLCLRNNEQRLKKKEIKKRHLQGFAILIIYHPDNFQV